jgi:ascorbate-specific PTS system EIIC-type component UlaA
MVKTIIEFLASADVWANIVGGIVAAVVLGFIACIWRKYREWRIKQLGDLMGRII